MPDAKIEVKDLLIDKWDATATDLGKNPSIYTGRYDRSKGIPAVALSSKSEGPVNGGGTGFSGMTPGGNQQTIRGSVVVDAAAGSWEDLEGAAADGSDVSPKKLREQLYQHAAQICVDHTLSTSFRYLSPQKADEIEDNTGSGDDGRPVEYRTRFRVRYEYTRSG